MEQETFVRLDDFDVDEVRLDEAPTSAEQYLKQVMVSRLQCPDVMSAVIAADKLKTPAGLPNAIEKESSRNAPPVEWQIAQNNDFSRLRSLVECYRAKFKHPMRPKWPTCDNVNGWKSLCLSRCISDVNLHLPEHQGTPPTLTLLLSLSERQINSLFEHQVQWFLDDGYSRPLCEWLYAVLAVLQKPLLPDLCNCMRELAKYCRQVRATLDADTQQTLINQLSLFIVIASVYFEQKDLAD